MRPLRTSVCGKPHSFRSRKHSDCNPGKIKDAFLDPQKIELGFSNHWNGLRTSGET